MQPTKLSGSLAKRLHSQLKLKRTFVARPDITDKTEQSKTHPFNFHKKQKHSYRAC